MKLLIADAFQLDSVKRICSHGVTSRGHLEAGLRTKSTEFPEKRTRAAFTNGTADWKPLCPVKETGRRSERSTKTKPMKSVNKFSAVCVVSKEENTVSPTLHYCVVISPSFCNIEWETNGSIWRANNLNIIRNAISVKFIDDQNRLRQSYQKYLKPIKNYRLTT